LKNSTLRLIFTICGFLAILLTILPFVAVDYWWIRMFDFPHLQLTIFTVLAIILYIIKFDFGSWKDYSFIGVLILCAIFQFTKIFPYTTFAKYEVLDSTNDSKTLSLLTANVLQHNSNYDAVNNLFKSTDADIQLFTETNDAWQKNISENLSPSYISKVEVPKSNTYGMLLYSKLKIFDTHVKYLVSDSVPSIHTKLKLSTNDTIQLYAIHPTPPMPSENPSSANRDAEMMMIAEEALRSKYPVIVIGDFNDVAWSQTSKLFQNVSRLLDVRKGRGLFNTYNAQSNIMRWPLDHIFISSHFRLKKIKRCEDVHSDHFPLFTKLSFEPNLKAQQIRPYPSDKDFKNAKQQIKDFRDNDPRKNN